MLPDAKNKYLSWAIESANPESQRTRKNRPHPQLASSSEFTSMPRVRRICQYYRKFVPNFSENAALLHALTEKGARFIWDDSYQAAFDHLKNALTTAPTLDLPNDEGEFLLDCDAYDHAIGAVLSQVQDGVEKPICYASQLYNRHEKNYNVTRKELLAVVTFVRTFRQYLLGRQFLVRTVHAALQWLKRTPQPIGQQARWLEIL